jgi:hypothetical protein
MSFYSILISVENYIDGRIPPVIYAENDSIELAQALKDIFFEDHVQAIHVNERATKTLIESHLRKQLNSLSYQDVLAFYYAGHGFAKDGMNYITCYDTNLDDLANTSIPVSWLFEQFQSSECTKIVMFLDSCESGMLAADSIRGIFSDLTEKELNDFFNRAEHCVCFASCKPGQYSYPSTALKHGIWTYHLIEALRANEDGAMENGHLITSASLQNYLSINVPRTIRNKLSGTETQTPWFYGAQSSDFLIADVAHILSRRKSEIDPNANQLKRARLLSEQLLSIRRLSGFKQGHKVPDRITDSTGKFVINISEKELNDDFGEVFSNLKNEFKFKRRDIEIDTSAGSISAITPYFDYEVSISQNQEDPSTAVFLRQISNIREPDALFSEEFDNVFKKIFDTLEFTFHNSIDLSDLVDRLEEIGDSRITIRYDKDLLWCSIQIEGLSSKIVFTPKSISIVEQSTKSPQHLIEAFFEVQKQLVNTHQIMLLPFEEDGEE